jgi:membrane fusion protein, heavy metal efflux system
VSHNRVRSVFCLVLLAAAIPLASCAKHDASAPPDPSSRPSHFVLTPEQRDKIRVEPVSEAPYRRTIQTTGIVAFDADQATQVLSPISGPVARILVEVGAHVGAGEPLATISSPDFAAAVNAYRKADAAARNVRRIADLDKQLFENDAIARREMEQAETDAVGAEADRDAALQQIRSLGVDDRTIDEIRQGRPVKNELGAIRSPIEGTVVEKLITPGQLLQAGATPAFTVANLSTVWVMANVFESDLPFVQLGDPAEVTAASGQRSVAGRVGYVAALVDVNTRAVAVRVVARNPGEILKKDMYVDVRIQSARQSTGLLVPVSAVLRDDENLPFVFLADADGSFSRRRITLGPRVKDQYDVASGLRKNDRVVVEGGLFMQFAQNQ